MRHNVIVVCLLCFALVFVGCTQETKEEPLCVKCGGVATTTLSGPADIIEKYGISINDCTQITSFVYSAYVCESCVESMGPVADPFDLS